MTPIIMGVARHILSAAGAGLAAKGYIGESDVEALVGALVTIGAAIWSAIDKRQRVS